MENSFKNIIDQSKSILILLPTKPYFDQVAAGLSLYLALREEKDIQISSPSPMTVEFNRIIGVNRVSQELGNKNLVIRFVDYPASDIERVSYDIEDGQFRLTVIPKTGLTPPGKEQIQLSYSGVSSDCVIIIGGANESHFPAISSKELASANIVHVGTKDLTLSSGKSYISFSRPASSVSEVVASLIKESGIALNEDIATNLLMGIEDASGNFTQTAVSAETFAIVADLMRAGGRRLSSQGIRQTENFPQGAIPAAPYTAQVPVQAYQQAQQRARVQQLAQNPVQNPIQAQNQNRDDNLPKNPAPLGTTEPQVQKLSQEEPEDKNAPQEWLTTPKIYKGNSVS